MILDGNLVVSGQRTVFGARRLELKDPLGIGEAGRFPAAFPRGNETNHGVGERLPIESNRSLDLYRLGAAAGHAENEGQGQGSKRKSAQTHRKPFPSNDKRSDP